MASLRWSGAKHGGGDDDDDDDHDDDDDDDDDGDDCHPLTYMLKLSGFAVLYPCL